MENAEPGDDSDYRIVAQGYLTRARRTLARMEGKRTRLPIQAVLIATLPTIATAMPNLNAGPKLHLQIVAMVLGIAAAVLIKRSELAGRGTHPKESLRDLILELETVLHTGQLDPWHRKVVDEAGPVLQRLAEQ